MKTIQKKHLVKKRNVLNELRANNMTLQELRFFSIYLSKINSADIKTRIVKFPINDFKKIMELDRININYLKQVTDSLLCKIVHIPNERGGYEAFQLFKECRVDVDKNGEWYMEIDAHDKALPLMFEFQSRFFSYQLWNALRLRSSNQLRMYEILKQYEKIGTRVIEIEELKSLLGIGKDEYQKFNNFKKRVLDACRLALKESTDIKFTYESYGKKGKGGKVLSLKFCIEKNDDYDTQMTLEEFIQENQMDLEQESEQEIGNNDNAISEIYNKRIEFLSDACNNEFSFQEVVVLFNQMEKCLPPGLIREDIQSYDYLSDKYNEMKMRNEKNPIKHRFAYLKSIIGKDYEP